MKRSVTEITLWGIVALSAALMLAAAHAQAQVRIGVAIRPVMATAATAGSL